LDEGLSYVRCCVVLSATEGQVRRVLQDGSFGADKQYA
jgi:anthranilate/para-aminobenzoate synthase component I